jgi:hypothetical protein
LPECGKDVSDVRGIMRLTDGEIVNGERILLRGPGADFMKPFRTKVTDKTKFDQIQVCNY